MAGRIRETRFETRRLLHFESRTPCHLETLVFFRSICFRSSIAIQKGEVDSSGAEYEKVPWSSSPLKAPNHLQKVRRKTRQSARTACGCPRLYKSATSVRVCPPNRTKGRTTCMKTPMEFQFTSSASTDTALSALASASAGELPRREAPSRLGHFTETRTTRWVGASIAASVKVVPKKSRANRKNSPEIHPIALASSKENFSH